MRLTALVALWRVLSCSTLQNGHNAAESTAMRLALERARMEREDLLSRLAVR